MDTGLFRREERTFEMYAENPTILGKILSGV
jgi:hypothetical protein